MAEDIILLAMNITYVAVFLAFLFFVVMPRTIGRRKGSAPFIPTRSRAVATAIELLQLSSGSAFYDLGCGDGRILAAAARSSPSSKIVGIDNDWLPLFFARMRTYRASNVTLIKADMYNVNLRDATHIYCYLFPEALRELESKILKECRDGTRIVTCDYYFPNLVPARSVELSKNKYMLARKMFLYVI